MKKLKSTIIVVVCVSIASMINFNFLVKGFIIAFSVVVVALFLYGYTELNPIEIAVPAGTIASLYKALRLCSNTVSFIEALKIVIPDMMFFFTYGFIFYFLYYKNEKKDLARFIFSIFCCDFLSNIVEMSIRTKVVGISIYIIKDLLVVAYVRILIILVILIGIEYYKSFVTKEEREKRYRKLILLTSNFKSEIYFMNKNTAEIEDVMKKSFSVYKIMSEKDYPDELKNLTLDIAKDIHEIKKDYIRVMRGLEDISGEKIDIEQMKMKDIIDILEIDAKDYIGEKNLDIKLDFKVERDFYVFEHFYLMSIIKNLIFNSIEAIDNKEKGLIKLKIEEVKDEYVFNISDNGEGINQSDLDFIFSPGFSTKYNEETGNACRGIGLTVVKDLVENIFKGSISVQSTENSGTIFTIKIPVNLFRR